MGCPGAGEWWRMPKAKFRIFKDAIQLPHKRVREIVMTCVVPKEISRMRKYLCL